MIMQISGLIAKEISQIDSLEFENPVDLCQAASRLTDSQIKLSNYRTKAVKALDKAKTELKAELKKEIQADAELLERLFAIVDNVNMN
jgi:arsenate reductase-like glutaredoxin family protein